MRRQIDDDRYWIALAAAFAVILYVSLAWAVFEWRNPLCNDMAFYRHLTSVVTWKRLPQYQEELTNAPNP